MKTNGKTYILYTTEIGGEFQVTHGTIPQWAEAVKTGVLTISAVWRGEGEFDEVQPCFMQMVVVEANHDFVLGMARERYHIETHHPDRIGPLAPA